DARTDLQCVGIVGISQKRTHVGHDFALELVDNGKGIRPVLERSGCNTSGAARSEAASDYDGQREPRARTPERAARTLARMRPRRALRVQLWTEPRGQVADNFELSTLGSFLCKSRRLVGGGCSHQRTILRWEIP